MAAPLRMERVDSTADTVLRNLLGHYLHDMAEWFGFDTDVDGAYAYPMENVWSDDCDVLLAYAGTIPIAFALVGQAGSRVPGTTGRDLKEFFVIRRHRRDGVGSTFARHVWDRYPGPWLVRVYQGNLPAVPFWRKVITDYTGAHFQEHDHRGDDGRKWSYFTFGSGRRGQEDTGGRS